MKNLKTFLTTAALSTVLVLELKQLESREPISTVAVKEGPYATVMIEGITIRVKNNQQTRLLEENNLNKNLGTVPKIPEFKLAYLTIKKDSVTVINTHQFQRNLPSKFSSVLIRDH
ncbi:MAG: hypothetical protein QNJ37_17680 [Crocosphaera sp.]|nr:hypothetical protein [Crocosphaera sp.]